MLYHAERTIYSIEPDYSLENWNQIVWEQAFSLIWKRLDYKSEDKVQEWFDFIKNRPNEVIIINGNLFQWIP